MASQLSGVRPSDFSLMNYPGGGGGGLCMVISDNPHNSQHGYDR